ncbi:MAG: steroid-22-oyl-CoA synthetase [Actinomycetota bacterium]
MPAANAAALLRRNATDPAVADRPAIDFDGRTWTHREYFVESCRWAQLFLSMRPDGDAPFHVGVLLDNVPEFLFAYGAAALTGATIVGLNPTRRGENLHRDVAHTDVAFVVTEERHRALLDGVDLPMVMVEDPGPLDDATDPRIEPDPSTTWALIFTSGTSDAPKAVICSQRRLLTSAVRLSMIMDLGPDDVNYACMPLFHSNAVMVGWAPSLIVGASVGLARRFSASGWLPDVRRYGATYWNYTGKPLAYILATPESPDDADNPLRIAYGNEGSPQLVDGFSRRFGVRVIDAYGATEGGVAVNRDVEPRAGALGMAPDNVMVVSEDGERRPPARFDDHGRLANADECVGEIVNTTGAGPFEGYYKNDEAYRKATRNGWYWSGDLGYVDVDGYIYFAGRTADWVRVDGENFPAGPVENALLRHPDLVAAAVYGVPDTQAGDQAMACVVLRDGASFDGAAFAAWLDAQDDLGPKWRPRYVRVTKEMPTTGTNKIVKRQLALEKFRTDLVDGDAVYVRDRGEAAYRAFTASDEATVRAALTTNGRERFWDL